MSQAETAELLQGIKGKRKQHGFGGQSGSKETPTTCLKSPFHKENWHSFILEGSVCREDNECQQCFSKGLMPMV